MNRIIGLIFFMIMLLYSRKTIAQNTTLGSDSITIIGTDTIIGPPITFRKYDEKFIDFMFFDGNYNVVAFRIAEKSSCFQLMLSSLDSNTYCFTVGKDEFKLLMSYLKDFSTELATQSNWPVKCDYCQTLQMFWYDGDKERSTIKRSFLIPDSFNTILDFCYELSADDKKKCNIDLKYFQSLEGFDDNLRGPSSNK